MTRYLLTASAHAHPYQLALLLCITQLAVSTHPTRLHFLLTTSCSTPPALSRSLPSKLYGSMLINLKDMLLISCLFLFMLFLTILKLIMFLVSILRLKRRETMTTQIQMFRIYPLPER